MTMTIDDSFPMSLDDGCHISTSRDSLPCIFLDRDTVEVGDDSTVTFWSSFISDCSLDMWEEESELPHRQQQQQPNQVPRIPRRSKTFGLSSSGGPDNKFGMKPPKRRSTKSSLSFTSSIHEHNHSAKQATANAMIQCRLQSLTKGQKIRRVDRQASERFQEEPQARKSLELPAVPQRKKSILQFSSSQLFLGDDDDDDDDDSEADIASALASLAQD